MPFSKSFSSGSSAASPTFHPHRQRPMRLVGPSGRNRRSTLRSCLQHPSLDHGKSSDQIERIAKKSGFAKSSSHANLLGLTHSSTGPTLSAATNSQEVAPGKYCVRLDRVRLTIGSRKTNVYIDRKYRKSSCAYKTILAHEMEHVRINEQIVQDYMPKIRRELKERAAGIEPFYTKNPKKARRSIANRLLFELDPLLEEFNEARLRANDVIDTPEAYAATQAKCRDW